MSVGCLNASKTTEKRQISEYLIPADFLYIMEADIDK